MLLKDFREPLISFEWIYLTNFFCYRIENSWGFTYKILGHVGPLGENLRPHSFWDFSGRGIAGISIPNSTCSVQVKQKSFYSGIKVQSSSKSITTIQLFLLFQLFHSLGWNRWNTLPVLPIPKKCCIPFTIPLFHLFIFEWIYLTNFFCYRIENSWGFTYKILGHVGPLGENLRPHSFWDFSGRGIAGISIPNSTYSVQMEQKSFYSGIKVQSSSKSITTIQLFLLFQLFHSLGWNRWNTLPVLPIPKKCCIPFTIPLFHLFLFPKIIKRNTSLIFCPP